MKYLQLIVNRFLFAMLCLSALPCLSQLNTISPYSRFGIGELESQNSVFGSSLSGSMVALSPFHSINYSNPASYSSLVHPVLQTGLTVKNFELENSETKERNYLSKINEISVGLPLNKGMAVAFGITPFSSVGYAFTDRSESLIDGTGASYSYTGNGGFTRGYLGASYRKSYPKEEIVLNSKGVAIDTVNYIASAFSLGVNGNLIFGSVDYNSDVLFDNLTSSYHRLESSTSTVGDTHLSYGFQYKKNVKTSYVSVKGATRKTADWNLSLGGAFTPQVSMGVTESKLIQNAVYNSNISDLIPEDTISFSRNKGQIILPAKLQLGAALSIQNKNSREFEFSVAWENQNWTNYSNNLDLLDQNDTYGDVNKFSFGFQYTPKPLLERDIPWYKTTVYQFGLSMGENLLRFDSESLKEQRVSLGVSIPILGSKTYSRINLGMDFGTLGSTENGLIKETSLNSYIGFSLMPDMKRNGWFKQSKYR